MLVQLGVQPHDLIVESKPPLPMEAAIAWRSYPRLVMLWMYAECAASMSPPEQRDSIASTCDFLLALGIETREVAPMFEQAMRLFACRFHVDSDVVPMIEPSVLRRAGAAVCACDAASYRRMELVYGDAFCRELTGRRLRP